MRIKFNAENLIAALLFAGLLLFPAMASEFKVLNVANFLILVFLSLSLSLIWGYTGIFSFGQSAFFGIGGYAYALLFLNNGEPSFTPVALVVGVLISFAAAWIIGYFMFYGGVNDVFVGLITLCVTLVLETFMAQTAGSGWKIGSVPMGGYNGINGISPLALGSFTFSGNKLYYFVLILLIVIYLALRKLIVSKWGFALLAIRENRQRSYLFGYNVPKIQTMVFALGGALASLSGILYATWGGYITPSTMSLASATLPVVLVAAGGRKNLTAAMIFTLIYSWFSQYLASSGSQYALVILGVALILVVRFLPEGIIVAIFNGLDRLLFVRKKQDAGAVRMVKEGIDEKPVV